MVADADLSVVRVVRNGVVRIDVGRLVDGVVRVDVNRLVLDFGVEGFVVVTVDGRVVAVAVQSDVVGRCLVFDLRIKRILIVAIDIRHGLGVVRVDGIVAVFVEGQIVCRRVGGDIGLAIAGVV